MNHDRITELYRGDLGPPASQRRARARIHWMCAAAEGTDVLDLGCSQGIASILLAREGHRVTGVDVERVALDFAEAERTKEEPHVSERLEFRFAEGADLPFADGSFDTVLLGEVIEHQVDPAPILREARRVLRPHGALVVTFPYGIFRYQDHKEPIYLGPVLALLGTEFGVERVARVERWIGVVARAGGTSENRYSDALGVAETRLAEVESAYERRGEELREVRTGLQQSAAEAEVLRTRLADAEAELTAARERIDSLDRTRRAAEERPVTAVRPAPPERGGPSSTPLALAPVPAERPQLGLVEPHYEEAPMPRSAYTARGIEVSHAELAFAAEVSRFPARFGLPIRLNGFLAWRAYRMLRALWRLLRRPGRPA